MSSPGADPWGPAQDQSASDPWAPAANQDQPSGFSEDHARDAVNTLAPGATITSQARTPAHNAEVGGVPDSMHLGAQATDIVLPKGMTAQQFKAQLLAQGYPVTEFLDEGNHVHWGWGPKGANTSTATDPWAPAQPANDGRWHNTPQENADMDTFMAADKAAGESQGEAQPLPSDVPAAGNGTDFTDADLGRAKDFYSSIIKGSKSAIMATPGRWQQLAGSAIQAMGEHPGIMDPDVASAIALAPPKEQDQIIAAHTAMGKLGAQIYADASANLKATMPGADAPSAERTAYQVAAGTIDMLPLIAATAITKNPVVGGAIMAGQAGTSSYGAARAGGRTADQAAMDATFSGLVNGTLGTLPLGALMRPGQTFLGKTIQSAGTFGAISVLTEAMQLGYDKGLVTPDMNLKQAMERLEDAGITGTLQGALLGGGHAGLEAAVNRLHAATPAPETPAQPVAATTTPPARPASPAPAGPIHADVRASLGLERPGEPPAVDPWGPAAAETSPNSAPETPITNRAAAAPPSAAAVEGPGIARRALEPDVAVTSSGREVPVQYALVEASHLVPSQTQEGNPNPAFPAELQPRDRTRAVSQAQIASIAQNINPRLLDRSVNASDGAPIVAPSGVVESGNGRSLAIQRAYADGLPSAAQYRDYLAERGYPVEGMEQPMLVRIRSDAMSPEDRQAFVREANQSGQLGYSATERAMSDAAAMPDYALSLFRGGEVEGAANREFVRSFMSHALPANEHAGMVDANGNLSLDGARRVRAALLAKAYADPDLVGSVVENGDSSIKAIGNALTDAAPDWSMMRAAAAKGEIPPALDQTGKLLDAVRLVARARADGRNVAEFVGQPDIFTGQSIDPDTEAWLRLMFRNTKDWTQPVGRDKLAEALQFYAREAQKSQVGQNLLGEQPVSAGDVLSIAKRRQYAEQTAGTGPSLSFGEDVRARRVEGGESGPQGPAARGGEGDAAPGTEEHASQVREAQFGPMPKDVHLRPVSAGESLDLGAEAWDFSYRAGIDPSKEPIRAIGPLANWVLERGRKFGFESLGAIGERGEITAATDGLKGSVEFKSRMLARLLDPAQQLVSVHNHPSNSSFSGGDIATLVYPGHKAMVVVGHDGEWHAAALAATLHGTDKAAMASMLAGIQKGARKVATGYTDQHYNARTLTPDEADHMLSAITMLGLERAGVIRYMGPLRIHPKFIPEVQHVVNKIAAGIRLFLEEKADQGVRAGGRGPEIADRPARPIQLADGVAELIGQPGQSAAQPGSGAGAPASAGRSGVPQPGGQQLDLLRPPTAQQLRLLEEERRYTETPEFKRWFGDSRVVDAENRPKVMFHVGNPGVEAFRGMPTSSHLIYFNETEAGAREGARNKDQVYPVYLKVETPFGSPDRPLPWHEAESRADRIRADGYDGVYVKDEGGISLAVFDGKQIKSATGNRGTFDPNDPSILREDKNRYERDRSPFYSALTRAIEDTKMSRAPAKDWLGLIDNLRAKGVKQEEIDWSGVKDWIGQQTGPVTRDQVLAHLRDNEVRVQEVEKSSRSNLTSEMRSEDRAREIAESHGRNWADMGSMERQSYFDEVAKERDGPGTKFSQYTLPGGENYRELLLTLPKKDTGLYGQAAADAYNRLHQEMHAKYGNGIMNKATPEERARLMALDQRSLEKDPNPQYRSSHWDEPNILAHIRFDDRTGPNGEKILHMAEVQSDWHQAGRRRGYARENSNTKQLAEVDKKLDDVHTEMERRHVRLSQDGADAGDWETAWAKEPELKAQFDALYAERNRIPQTSNPVPDAPFKATWHELALKRMMRYAAEHGYDKLSWDTGEMQAARYDLSRVISKLRWYEKRNGNIKIEGDQRDGGVALNWEGNPDKMDDVVGKDVADKIRSGAGARPIEHDEQAYTRVGELKGVDLKVGGEGMKGFYDKILPAAANKIGKKFGAKVEDTKLVGESYPSNIRRLEGQRIEKGGNVVHSIDITPAMRESVMQGQPLFDEARRYSEEPGAVDAHGKPLPQSIIPGAEPSAVQLAKARAGKLGTKVEQKAPGGLFGAQGVPGDDQLSLFEDGRRYAEIPRDDREVLEKAARTGDWIGKYRAEGATPDTRIRSAISRAFQAWRRSAGAVPAAVRSIFSDISKGGAPGGFSDQPTSRPTEAFSEKVKRAAAAAMDLVHDAQMLIAPMAEGTPEARATAKDFANMMRLARWHGNRMMEGLKKAFTPDQRRKMWEAADEESVLRQNGEATAGRGLSTLTAEERRAVLEQQTDAQNVWKAAKDQGMVQGEGLPSYVPRMMVEMARTGVQRLGSGENEVRSIPGIGRNLKTQTGQMKHREHLTAEETERAGSRKFDTTAAIVRDIQTLPLATMKLREAVAGRALINKIKEIGAKTGEDTVVEGHEPAGTPYHWFTLDNPAFKTWRPKLIKNEETGKYEPAKDQNGEIVFEKVPLFVRSDFEGPLRAVLSQDSGKVYNALMDMKGRAMTAIMYSPLIHNAVEWGRALPGMPGKVATFRIYFEGNKAKNDPETMTQAIMHGLVPIGHRGGQQDITSIANVDSVKAGRSWTAKIVGAIPGLFSRDAKEAVYRTIDKMGDLWHNTLLWDRVGDLQMGLYTNFRDSLIKKGNSPDAAAYMAAHFANRYAGALPLESMSSMSRKIANLALFSRTYTLGNLGAMKDVITGLPRDVQAQIARDGTLEQLKGIRSMAARKALAILATDVALFYAGNSILQSAVSSISGRQDLSEIEKGYVDRLKGLLSKVNESPLELLNPFADMQAVSATSENEPGRQNRVLAGYDHNGTAIYARNPAGKIGEEFTNWLVSPLQTLKSKFSTVLQPTYQVLTNDAGFGRQVYDPKAQGLSGLAANLGHVISLYLSSQLPLDSLKSTANILKGQGSEIDTYKALGPLAGVTFSKGAPGGPGVGELFELRAQHDAKQAAAMPGIIEKIRTGDIAGARTDMRALGISPGLQNYYVRVTQNPRLRLNTKSARELLRQATPEERARILQSSGGQ